MTVEVIPIEEAERLSGWGDPTPLEQQGDSPPAFPLGTFLSSGCRDFVSDTADRLQVPPDFIAIPLLVAVGTAIGAEFKMGPKALDGWNERPCLWGGIVSEPGTAKTPAFNAALGGVFGLQREQAESHKATVELYEVKAERAKLAERAWKEQCKDAGKAGEPMPDKPDEANAGDRPAMPRIWTGDTTQEKLVDILNDNPRGVLLYHDELSGWFKSMNQYRPGADRQFYLQAHAGTPYVKDRIGSGTMMLDEPFLSVFGGFQPEVVRAALTGQEEDGMAARFSLLVWPEVSCDFTYVDRKANRAAKDAVDALMRQLRQYRSDDFFGPDSQGWDRVLRFESGPAQQVFIDWFTRTQRELRGEELPISLRHHVSKYPGLFARLATCWHLARYAEKETAIATTIDLETATAVAGFIDNYLRPHAVRLYQYIGGDPAHQGAKQIGRWIIQSEAINRFTRSDITRKGWSGLKDKANVDGAISILEENAWIKRDKQHQATGRPTDGWQVNPNLPGDFCRLNRFSRVGHR